MKFLWSVTLMVAVGLAVVSCGGDDDDDGAAGSTGAGAGGMSGTSGVAGHTGGSGGSTMMSTGVPCGVTTCMGMSLMIPGAPPGAGGMFGALLPQPCCLDASMNKCGQSTMGGACMPPPPPPVIDSRCPPLMVPVIGSMPGCCIDNMCGVNASLLGMGCLENGKAAMGGMGGSPIPLMFPPPQKCDEPPPMMTTDDGGTMMMPPTNQGDAGI